MADIIEIDTQERFAARYPQLANCVVQGLDLQGVSFREKDLDLVGTYFLGCVFADAETSHHVLKSGGVIFPRFGPLPYEPWRSSLYTWQELMEGGEDNLDQSRDALIYHHFVKSGRDRPGILEALSQRIHDHAIDNALHELLGGRRVVGIMGGHGVSREEPMFHEVALLASRLTREGYFVATGGGPGVMEAANLGAWLARRDPAALQTALTILGKAPHYTHPGYVQAARAVWDQFPEGEESLAIPTWFYGHEPVNLFASHVAKYFSNSLREDGLLAVSIHGVVFAPGSAGTLQEVFMDLCQNHYGTLDWISPMVFLGRDYYGSRTQVFPLIRKFAEGRSYRKWLALVDDAGEAFQFIQQNPPAPAG